MKGKYLRGLAGDNDILVLINDTTNIVDYASKIHDTKSVSSAAFGRTLSVTSLMGLLLKGDKSNVSVQINGSGKIKKIFGFSDNEGNVKGYITHPHVEMPLNAHGKLDVGGAVGKHGKIVVIRDIGMGNPYIGQSDIVTGEIAEDMVYYYMYSEQQPSVISLGVLVSGDDEILSSGGIMIQTLPNIKEENIELLEKTLMEMRPISAMIKEGKSLEEIYDLIMKDIPHKITDSGEIEYKCDCSHEKVSRALISMGVKELEDMIKEDGKAELSCHFCNRKYLYSEKDLKNLVIEIKRSKESEENME